MNHGITSEEIGERMKAFRLGAGLTPEELAEQSGVSRAAIYRYEAGQPARIDVLVKISDLLGVSLPTLLGAGVEYITSAISFFERLRQLEENADQITVLFGPISYLLTTDNYDRYLGDVLRESIPTDVEDRDTTQDQIEILLSILRARKEIFKARNPNIISLVSATELARFVRTGFIGSDELKGVDLEERRAVALSEAANIAQLLRSQPIGTQLGIVIDSMPGTSLQICKRGARKSVAVSPFRLGNHANVRLGVATISSAPDATELYQSVTNALWSGALKNEKAAEYIENNILR